MIIQIKRNILSKKRDRFSNRDRDIRKKFQFQNQIMITKFTQFFNQRNRNNDRDNQRNKRNTNKNRRIAFFTREISRTTKISKIVQLNENEKKSKKKIIMINDDENNDIDNEFNENEFDKK